MNIGKFFRRAKQQATMRHADDVRAELARNRRDIERCNKELDTLETERERLHRELAQLEAKTR